MSDRVLGVSRLSKTYSARPPVPAVVEVDLAVDRGEVVAFVGPNGAGKTTTLRLVLAHLRPDSGRVRLFGQPATDPSLRRRVGYLPETFRSYGFLSAGEALGYYGRLSGVLPEELSAAVTVTLGKVGLGADRERKIAAFSRGMRQRLGLAQALVHEPDLLILDEPTGGLDPGGRRLVSEIIAEQKERGTAVLLSSHVLPDVERVADRMVMIRRGRIVLDERVERLRAGSGGWRIEIAGYGRAAAAALEESGFEATGDSGTAATVRCSGSRKRELLRLLGGLQVEIVSIEAESSSLEEIYMARIDEGRND